MSERKPKTVIDYFFRRENRDGNTVLVPRKDFVQRDELWNVLEWYNRKIESQNRLGARLRRLFSQRLFLPNPFAAFRARTQTKANGTTPEPAAEPRPAGFDANGRSGT